MLSSNMTYVVAGAAAVVLIALILVVVVARGRGRNTRVATGLDTRPEWTSLADPAVDGPADTASESTVKASFDDVGEGPAPPEENIVKSTPETTVPQDAMPVAPTEPAATLDRSAPDLDRPAAELVPSATPSDRPAATLDLRPGIEPVVTLVTSLLQYSGDLDPEELRRLELYRPERVVAAVDALTPSMTGRSSESKRARLARIRQYADSLATKPVDEPTATDVFVADPTPFRQPEVWGVDGGGTTLTPDPELSLLNEQPAPAAEDAPAAEIAPAAEAEPTAEVEPGHDKKAAIDELVRDATPEALSRLQRYLDDPDPEVQIHALSAAERLLGPE